MLGKTHNIQDSSSTLLRCLTGLTLLWAAHHFIVHESLLKQLLWSGPLPFLTFIAGHIIIATHLAGGAMLIFGFVTRIAALIQIPIVAGAVAIHLSMSSIPQELSALYLAPPMLLALVTIFVFGPSKFSVDSLIGLDNSDSDEDSVDGQLSSILVNPNTLSPKPKTLQTQRPVTNHYDSSLVSKMELELECPIEQARRLVA